jgi:hypothetical protein
LPAADWVQTSGTLSVSSMSSQNQMLDATKCARPLGAVISWHRYWPVHVNRSGGSSMGQT